MIEPLYLFGIPVDFILFGLTLLGVALFHHNTLAVSLTGLAAITLYDGLVPGFRALLAEVDGDLPAFYQRVRRIAALPPSEREAILAEAAARAPSTIEPIITVGR